MPRISRENQIEESLTYHVYNRGNAKLEIFHDDRDYEHFLWLTKKYKQRYDLQIFHWALMFNHFHFVLTMEDVEFLSKCIGGFLQSYVQYHHKRWKSAGKLWQGRFKSQPVQKETYSYECGRYIERNPLRAGIVKYPWEYQWSSCSLYVDPEKQNDGITTIDPMYETFGENSSERIERYKEWLMEGEESDFKNLDSIVGDENFKKKLLRKSGRLYIKKRGRPPIVK